MSRKGLTADKQFGEAHDSGYFNEELAELKDRIEKMKANCAKARACAEMHDDESSASCREYIPIPTPEKVRHSPMTDLVEARKRLNARKNTSWRP